MQEIFLELKEKIKSIEKNSFKISFFSTFIFGMFAHAYCFLNENFSHDSLDAMHSEANQLYLGRIFRHFYQSLRGYWELPWLNGVLSIIYISLAMVLINEILEKKNIRY